MSGRLIVDTIRNSSNSINLSSAYFSRRVLQRTVRKYENGLWNPGNTYYEIPGTWLNITPFSNSSYISYRLTTAASQRGNYAHAISHWIFMCNGREWARHCTSNDHVETGHSFKFEIPSWGAGRTGNMGFVGRQYGDGNHCIHFHGSRYRDGSDYSPPSPAQVIVEEYELDQPATLSTLNGVTSGCICYLDAKNPSSYPGTGTTVFDLSGNNNHFTIVGNVTWDGQAWGNFTGNSTGSGNKIQRASFPLNLKTSQGGAGLTWFVVAKCTAPSSGWRKLIGNNDGDNYIDIYANSSTQNFATESGDTFYVDGTSYVPNNYFYMADGVRRVWIGQSANAGTTTNPAGALTLGNEPGNNNYPWFGDISAMVLYNRQLSGEEIRKVANFLRNRFNI